MNGRVLDVPVPREVVSQVLPEALWPMTEIQPLGPGTLVGCLRRVPLTEVTLYEGKVSEQGYKWTTLVEGERAHILYHDKLDIHVQRAIVLESRDLALLEPALSLREHLELANYYGVVLEARERFTEAVLVLMRSEELFDEAVTPAAFRHSGPGLKWWFEPQPDKGSKADRWLSRTAERISGIVGQVGVHAYAVRGAWNWELHPVGEEEAVKIVNSLFQERHDSVDQFPPEVEYNREEQYLSFSYGNVMERITPKLKEQDVDDIDMGAEFEPSGDYQRFVFTGLTLEGDEEIQDMINQLAGRAFPGIKYVGEITTLPGQGGEGGRTDQVFDIPAEHVGQFAVWRLGLRGLVWWEDYVDNNRSIIPPADIAKYSPEGEAPPLEDEPEDEEDRFLNRFLGREADDESKQAPQGQLLEAKQVVEELDAVKQCPPSSRDVAVDEDEEELEVKPMYIQYVKTGNAFTPAGKIILKPKLERCAYRVVTDITGPKFIKTKADTDELLRFEHSAMDQVITEIRKFWELKPNYEKLGFMHNRGLLVHGPPGTGKSCLMQQVAEMMIQRGDVIFFANNVHALRECLKAFREVEPERKVVVILEDLDEYIGYCERDLLQLLDGNDKIDNVLFLGSTNYIDRFPPRLVRPGRFDKRIFLGEVSRSGRIAYLRHKLHDIEGEERIEKLADQTKGLTFADLREFVLGVYALKEPVDEVLQRLKDSGDVVADDLHESRIDKLLEQTVAATPTPAAPPAPPVTPVTEPEGTQATHTQCKFYAPKPDQVGMGHCSQYNKDVRGDEQACSGFQARVQEMSKRKTAEEMVDAAIENEAGVQGYFNQELIADFEDEPKPVEPKKGKGSEVENVIRTLLRESGTLTARQIAKQTHKPLGRVQHALTEMRAAGNVGKEALRANTSDGTLRRIPGFKWTGVEKTLDKLLEQDDEDKCPKCGAPVLHTSAGYGGWKYHCGSYQHRIGDQEFEQSEKCREWEAEGGWTKPLAPNEELQDYTEEEIRAKAFALASQEEEIIQQLLARRRERLATFQEKEVTDLITKREENLVKIAELALKLKQGKNEELGKDDTRWEWEGYPEWKELFDKYSQKGYDPAEAAALADQEFGRRQKKQGVPESALDAIDKMLEQDVVDEALQTVEMTIKGIDSDTAELELPGMKPIPCELNRVRDWVEDNWGRGNEVVADRTLTQQVDVGLLFDFFSGPGVDVNDFVTEKPPSGAIASSGDLQQYFQSLSREKGAAPEAPPASTREPVVPAPEQRSAEAAPNPEPHSTIDENFKRYLEAEEDLFIVFSKDGSYVSQELKKPAAVDLKKNLEDEGVAMLMVPAAKFTDAFADTEKGKEPPREESERASAFAAVNRYGDLVCPYCEANILTPYDYEIQPGSGKCPVCKESFKVTERVAIEANAKSKESEGRDQFRAELRKREGLLTGSVEDES